MINLKLTGISLLLVIVMVACQAGTEKPSATPALVTVEASATSIASDSQDSSGDDDLSANDNTTASPSAEPDPSDGVSQSEQAYPGPSDDQPTVTTQAPDPSPTSGSQSETTPTETEKPYPPPETQSPYPAPATQAPYPQPATQPVATSTPTATVVPEVSTPTPTSLTVSPTITGQTPLVHSGLVATDPQSFEIVSGKFQLVEFFAFWCPTCKSMAAVIHQLENEYPQVNFVYLDIDDQRNEENKQVLGFLYQPHFFLLDDEGEVLHSWLGYKSAEEIKSEISAFLQ